jgi:hypothetical protein
LWAAQRCTSIKPRKVAKNALAARMREAAAANATVAAAVAVHPNKENSYMQTNAAFQSGAPHLFFS